MISNCSSGTVREICVGEIQGALHMSLKKAKWKDSVRSIRCKAIKEWKLKDISRAHLGVLWPNSLKDSPKFPGKDSSSLVMSTRSPLFSVFSIPSFYALFRPSLSHLYVKALSLLLLLKKHTGINDVKLWSHCFASAMRFVRLHQHCRVVSANKSIWSYPDVRQLKKLKLKTFVQESMTMTRTRPNPLE